MNSFNDWLHPEKMSKKKTAITTHYLYYFSIGSNLFHVHVLYGITLLTIDSSSIYPVAITQKLITVLYLHLCHFAIFVLFTQCKLYLKLYSISPEGKIIQSNIPVAIAQHVSLQNANQSIKICEKILWVCVVMEMDRVFA